jgi:hypothetical protein
MRIHSDSLDTLEVRKAARLAGVGFTRFDLKGSRSRENAWDVILTGDSGRRQNGGEDEAASWDQWGIFLGHLFRLDSDLKTPYYGSADEFIWKTGGRFTPDFTPADCHRNHKWGWGQPNVTHRYSVATCDRGSDPCGAIQRWMLDGKFADLSA